MTKFGRLIAALHASALALAVPAGPVQAQDATEVRAYMNALAVGTPDAMTAFKATYPRSTLPGSELGASIAASIDRPTPTVVAAAGPPPGVNQDHGIY